MQRYNTPHFPLLYMNDAAFMTVIEAVKSLREQNKTLQSPALQNLIVNIYTDLIDCIEETDVEEATEEFVELEELVACEDCCKCEAEHELNRLNQEITNLTQILIGLKEEVALLPKTTVINLPPVQPFSLFTPIGKWYTSPYFTNEFDGIRF